MSANDFTKSLAPDEPRHVTFFTKTERIYAGVITLDQAWQIVRDAKRHGIITAQDNVQTHIDLS